MDYDFGMVGLGTMGRNMLLNLADHGASVAGLDLGQDKVDLLHKEGAGKPVQGFTTAKEFVASLRKPRVAMLLVPAGVPVDGAIKGLLEFMEPGDLIIDGGNSYFKDTERRSAELAAQKIAFFGMGVSGGEKGARYGPSMMAGGPEESYDRMKPLLESIAARAEDGSPCVKLLGPGAAGHYVKMVHNGIEYALMQTIAEIYDLLKRQKGQDNPTMAKVFEDWSQSEIGGFLLQITAEVLVKKADGSDGYLIDLVKDGAKSKGTGKWTSQDAMDLHVSVPSIDAAVSARDLSALREERLEAAKSYSKPTTTADVSVETLKAALGAAMIVAYAEGMCQLKQASIDYKYNINLGDAAGVWRAGCIIRSALLPEITNAYRKNPGLANLIVDPAIGAALRGYLPGLRETVIRAVERGIPVPALSAALSYIDGYTEARLPANLIQGQRDYFGAHTYERLDQPGVFHTDWSNS